MPELPEVETVRRALAPVVTGARIVDAAIVDQRLVRPFDPDVVAAELVGERVSELDRRGKYLIVRFDSGRVLLIHLRMTGSLRHGATGSLQPDAHRRAVLSMDNGSDVAYRDVRRFGTWELLESGEIDGYLAAKVGPEPLERLSARQLGAALARRRAAVKSVLLDQRVVAGLGNIYADEALWRARVHPLRPASSLDRDEVERVHRSIRHVLRLGIHNGGSTLRDYAAPDGSTGEMQNEFRVYGRDDEPCHRCRSHIDKIRVGGRGTWFCPTCQPAPDPEIVPDVEPEPGPAP